MLSLFLPGVGQIYNGQILKGLLIMLVLWPINVALMFVLIGFVTAFASWVWGIYDAYKTAERLNAGR